MKPSRNTGKILVALQFLLIAMLVWFSEPITTARNGHVFTLIMGVLGLIIGALSLRANPLGNFNIEPVPKPGGTMIKSGIYRYIRHPMYTSVILFGLACYAATPSAINLVTLIVLALVLHTKALLEEAWMQTVHSDYAHYAAGTKRYLPWVF